MAVATQNQHEILPSNASSQPVKWNRDQYHIMGEMGWFHNKRVELVGGEITEMTPIGDNHWIAVNRVSHVLREIFQGEYTISVQSSLKLSEVSEPEPDVAVIEGNVFSLRGVPTTAILVIEVADTTLVRDRSVKASLYASANIAEYWIVNLQSRQLEVYRAPQNDVSEPFGAAYSHIEKLNDTQTVAPLAVSKSSIAIADLLP